MAYAGVEPKVRCQMLPASSMHGAPPKGLNRMTLLEFLFWGGGRGGGVPLYIRTNLSWKHFGEFKLRESTSVTNLYEFKA